jgi:hypothetical protein
VKPERQLVKLTNQLRKSALPVLTIRSIQPHSRKFKEDSRKRMALGSKMDSKMQAKQHGG